ncbi:hypothetical protein BHM03_00011041 [Ensete ventricosum]|uniref:Retrotransposon gag domain-containing protein n=1 Tax=Ensete ventricosum TaxID=4639 RepID=A0A445MD34_ENSVE|nr:hypothetical protein BHM03_00011041 [Ensete ventricosum]
MTLWGPTRMWYSRLRSSSASCYDQLAKEFELNFLARARPKPTATSLLGLSQKDKFLAQFVVYCRFDRDYGNDTEECHDLKNQIEDLIRRGHLSRYLRKSREPSPHPKGSVEKQIGVIVSVPASGVDASSARKAYARATVEKRPRQENDPGITFQEYCKRPGERIMVNTRGSINILYFDAFHKLGLTDNDPVPMTSSLTGFIGDSISPLGTTTLPVTIEEKPMAKTLMVPFMVVGLPSVYNAILGCSTLNELRMVVSTYHRMMKFPTRVGVGEARSEATHESPDSAA